MAETPKVLVVEEDHELCEAQISTCVAALKEVMRAKSFDTLPRTVRDAVRYAAETRGGLPDGEGRRK